MSNKLKVSGLYKTYWDASVDDLPEMFQDSFRTTAQRVSNGHAPLRYGDELGKIETLHDYIRETGKLRQDNQESEKIALLKEGVEKYPDSFVLWHRLGRAYFFTEQYDEAIHALTEADRLKPSDEKIERDLEGAHRRGGSTHYGRHI